MAGAGRRRALGAARRRRRRPACSVRRGAVGREGARHFADFVCGVALGGAGGAVHGRRRWNCSAARPRRTQENSSGFKAHSSDHARLAPHAAARERRSRGRAHLVGGAAARVGSRRARDRGARRRGGARSDAPRPCRRPARCRSSSTRRRSAGSSRRSRRTAGADSLYLKSSRFEIGKPLPIEMKGGEPFTLYSNAVAPYGLSSYGFDDDGVPGSAWRWSRTDRSRTRGRPSSTRTT